MKDLKHLNKYLWKYRSLLFWGILFTIISNIFGIIPAPLVRQSFDLILDTISLSNALESTGIQENVDDRFGSYVLFYGVLIIIVALLQGVFLFLVRQTIIVMSRKIEYDLKNDIYNHYQSLPQKFYRVNNTGDLMNRISEDVSKVRMYLGPGLMYGINLSTLLIMVISYMLYIDVELTLLTLAPLPILSVSIYFVNNVINRKSEVIQQRLSSVSTFVQETFSGIRVVKAFNREKDFSKRFDRESAEYRSSSLGLVFVESLFFPLIIGLIGLSTIITVYFGGLQVIKGDISVGNVAEFIIFVNKLTWPVTSLGWISSIIQRAAASQRRINEFLNQKTHIVSEKNLKKDIEGSIEFENVSFEYKDSGVKALKNISFSIEAGKTLAVVGTTGSGKSTFADLIARLVEADSGSIKIDGIPIQDYELGHFRSQLGFVPQDVFLFSDTIEQNIGFGSVSFELSEVEKAARNAGVYENIIDFPKKFETKLGERGITLSGGQKQRVSIARALIRNPKILILDDALSAVDTKTEDAILKNLKEITSKRTSVIISHRVSSVHLADLILVMDQGELLESGDHESLMKSGGLYAEMYEKQSSSETTAPQA